MGGFSLLEMVMIITVVGIASVSLLSAFGQVGRALGITERSMEGLRIAQDCADFTLSSKRLKAVAYSDINSTVCDSLSLASGATRTVATTVIDPASSPLCPGGASCKQVDVQVTRGGTITGSLTFMVVDY